MLPKKSCQVESIKTVAMTLSCENNVHTFIFSLFFVYFITYTFNLYFILCEQMTNKKLPPPPKETTKQQQQPQKNPVQLHIASSGLIALC